MTVSEFIHKHSDDLDAIIRNVKYLKKSNFFNKQKYKPFNQQPYGKIMEFRDLISTKGITKAVAYFTKSKEKKVLSQDVKHFFYFVAWLYSEIKSVEKMEAHLSNLDSNESNQGKLQEAGIDVLNKYGYFGVLDELSNGNPIIYDIYAKKPFEYVFTKLMRDKEKSLVMSRYNDIITKK